MERFQITSKSNILLSPSPLPHIHQRVGEMGWGEARKGGGREGRKDERRMKTPNRKRKGWWGDNPGQGRIVWGWTGTRHLGTRSPASHDRANRWQVSLQWLFHLNTCLPGSPLSHTGWSSDWMDSWSHADFQQKPILPFPWQSLGTGADRNAWAFC